MASPKLHRWRTWLFRWVGLVFTAATLLLYTAGEVGLLETTVALHGADDCCPDDDDEPPCPPACGDGHCCLGSAHVLPALSVAVHAIQIPPPNRTCHPPVVVVLPDGVRSPLFRPPRLQA